MRRPFLYGWRVFAKWLSFFVFGLGTLILVMVIFPLMRLFIHPARRFRKSARAFVSAGFRAFFIPFMTLLGVLELDSGSPEAFRRLSGKIVAANHPSLLDVVMLISLIPNADCIVRGNLSKTIVGGVISRLYIPNDRGFTRLAEDCAASLEEGNCLIIFPEGSRTPRNVAPVFRRGAARIALAARRAIAPVRIGGTDKYGLGKKDPWTAFNPDDKYIYRLRLLPELSLRPYLDAPLSLGARRLTRELYRVLVEDAPSG